MKVDKAANCGRLWVVNTNQSKYNVIIHVLDYTVGSSAEGEYCGGDGNLQSLLKRLYPCMLFVVSFLVLCKYPYSFLRSDWKTNGTSKDDTKMTETSLWDRKCTYHLARCIAQKHETKCIMYHIVYGYCNNDEFMKADYDAMVTYCISEPYWVRIYVYQAKSLEGPTSIYITH